MTKKIAVLVLVLGMFVTAQATNLLWNGSFDVNSSGADGWWSYLPEPDNQAITIEAGTLSTLCAHISNATGASSQLGQSAAGAAGNTITVSGAFRSTNWGGAGITINYVDSSWAYLDYAYAQIYSGDGEDSGWKTFSFTTGSGEGNWTAPAGTAHITLKIEEWGWAEFSFDEMSLEVVPEPATMLILAIGGLLIRKKV